MVKTKKTIGGSFQFKINKDLLEKAVKKQRKHRNSVDSSSFSQVVSKLLSDSLGKEAIPPTTERDDKLCSIYINFDLQHEGAKKALKMNTTLAALIRYLIQEYVGEGK